MEILAQLCLFLPEVVQTQLQFQFSSAQFNCAPTCTLTMLTPNSVSGAISVNKLLRSSDVPLKTAGCWKRTFTPLTVLLLFVLVCHLFIYRLPTSPSLARLNTFKRNFNSEVCECKTSNMLNWNDVTQTSRPVPICRSLITVFVEKVNKKDCLQRNFWVCC